MQNKENLTWNTENLRPLGYVPFEEKRIAIMPARTGYLCITPSFKVAQTTKPQQKHLDNMQEYFG